MTRGNTIVARAEEHVPVLAHEARAAAGLIEWLCKQGMDDEDSVLCALGSETRLLEAADAAVDLIDDDEARIAGLLDKIERLQAKVGRLRERVRTTRSRLTQAVLDIGERRLPLGQAMLSVSAAKPKAVISSPDDIPQAFVRHKDVVTFDTEAIAAELQAGRPVPGASLANGGHVLRVTRVR